MNTSSLTTNEFHILFSLRSGSLHGYAIIKQVVSDTNGSVTLLTGTLYNAIKRLLANGLIAEAGEDASDSRRRLYMLTEVGVSALNTELTRYKSVVSKLHFNQLSN
jgi:DNA-binding PadR family transcriptional regulator